MVKIKSVAEFGSLRQRVVKEKGMDPARPCLVICAGSGGQASGANDIMRIIKKEILERNLHEKLSLRVTGCQGFCEMDPFIVVEPGNHLYPKLAMTDVPRIIDSALAGEPVDELLYKETGSDHAYRHQGDIPFFKKQVRTILGMNQRIDPIRIMDYIERGGYAAFEYVIRAPKPEWIVSEILRSGLRGRGGAGFLTGKKWALAREAGDGSTDKYLVCNADEGDPGAYMDRSLLEGNPHLILEGMIIGGIAVGACHGIIYVRSEYPLAVKHSMIAIRQARELGLLGQNILGSGIDFDIDVVRGAGAFVCGEETALIRSVEGAMGEPRQRPPYPIQRGILGRPTCINNVETWANVPYIINVGASEYVKIGAPGNTGTKIFSLVGKIKNTGLVEVPLGMKISEIVYDIGGGPAGKAKIKAVQTGGPSGGCIPARMFDLPVSYDTLAKAGAIMGSGGMIVMDENTCMVDVAKYFTNFLKGESCGKCFTCRKGTQRMYEILDDISKGKDAADPLGLLEELALAVKDTTMCGLGQTASNPVLSTLRYFREEYERHVHDKRCDAFVCKDLVGAPCQAACPLGTEAWRYVAEIARGDFEEAYRVLREPNPFPSVCARVCNHPCEGRCKSGTTGKQPIAIRALKRFVTDRIDPKVFHAKPAGGQSALPGRVAIVGAGPAGLTAAHYLSLEGHKVTVYEADEQPGGMLVSCIPPYRLPRQVLKQEIAALLNPNIALRCGTQLGRDVTIDGLFQEGFQAVFLALGAHRSRMLRIPGEDAEGVIPSIRFLKAANLRGEALAKGRVGVIGGGNSAIDAARVALRQPGVKSVSILYRRTRDEMPAFPEEIEAAIEEGVRLETLVSPVGIETKKGRLTGLVCRANELGALDASGRRRPVPIAGSDRTVPLDTLIVAISEMPDSACATGEGEGAVTDGAEGAIRVDRHTLATSRPGVFAGGDVTRGPSTVVDAIADGKRGAAVISRFLRGEPLRVPGQVRLPRDYVEQASLPQDEIDTAERPAVPHIPLAARQRDFGEIEGALSKAAAVREAKRCLRCDLEFTQPKTESGRQAGKERKAAP